MMWRNWARSGLRAVKLPCRWGGHAHVNGEAQNFRPPWHCRAVLVHQPGNARALARRGISLRALKRCVNVSIFHMTAKGAEPLSGHSSDAAYLSHICSFPTGMLALFGDIFLICSVCAPVLVCMQLRRGSCRHDACS